MQLDPTVSLQLSGQIMHSSLVQRRDDFGRHVRTQFELSEAGENNLVLDELQYQLDILFGKGATPQTQLLSLNNIVRIFTSNIPIGAQKLLRRSTEDLFTQVSSCLSEQMLVPSVLALILAISCNNDGSLNPNVLIPSEIVPNFLKCGKVGVNMQSNDMNSMSESLTAPIVISTDESADNNGYRKKRKFGSVVKQSSTVSVSQPMSESLLVRHYGSKRSNVEDSQTSMSQTSQAGSISGSSQNDDYWTDDCFLVPQSATLEAPLKRAPLENVAVTSGSTESALTATVVAPAGGFHRKRKLGNSNGAGNTNHLSVPAAANTSATSAVSAILCTVKKRAISDISTSSSVAISSATHSALSERFPALYSTFMPPSSSDQTLHTTSQSQKSTHILHLILLNRYLSARVQALATVKTDMFLSTENTDPDSEPRETLTSMGNGTEPQDAANNSNYDSDYRAQADSLAQMQAVMRDDTDDTHTCFLGEKIYVC